jgi:hypothetical protein
MKTNVNESGAYHPNSTQEKAAPRAKANVIVEQVVDPSAVVRIILFLNRLLCYFYSLTYAPSLYFSIQFLFFDFIFYVLPVFNQQDVLCGRGGMSNHHPGNEWYRRLIRSNRPLYRACPKHTKLLVAKAIVQAVQEQQGRFLERDFDTGVWYVIPYKRAVDKTSQGLRERERDDGPVSRQVTDMKAMLQYPEEGPPQMPSNRRPPPAAKAPPTKSTNQGKTKTAPPPPPTFTKQNAVLMAPQATMTASLPQGPMPQQASTTAMLPPPDALHRQPTMTPLPVGGTETQLLREASFYRLLKHTQLLPHQTSMMTTATDFRNYTSAVASQPTAIPPTSYYANPPPSMAMMASYGGAPPPTEPQTAPGLTRFTSQVSDWLNFFWPAENERPLPTAASAEAAPPPAVAAALPVKEEEAAAVPAPPTELEQSVSLTLLSLAGTPNKLFTGLFFGEQSTKKKDSLLDDHEETPMEQRIRTLPPPPTQQQQFA